MVRGPEVACLQDMGPGRGMDYHIRHLALKQIAQAFPLIREYAQGISLDQWTQFAESVIGNKGAGDRTSASGIVAAERLGYIRGLFSYAALPDLRHERVLLVQDFNVVELVRRDTVSQLLLMEMSALARRLSCGAVHALLQSESEWALLHFQRHGHQLQGTALCRPLVQLPASASV